MNYRYFATFVSGFKKIVAEIMRKQFPDIHVEELYDNLIVFSTNRKFDSKTYIPFLNNLCLLGNKFGSPAMQDFDKIVDWAMDKDTFWQVIESYIKKNKVNKYRIYFFENVTTISDQKNLTILKDFLSETLNLKYSATESEFEIWFVKRREGISLFGIRLTKKQDYQETLPQGQLRDELAYLLCAYAEPGKNDTILDPFCGYGSIPFTMAESFKVKKIFASDIDTERIRSKIEKENKSHSKIQISNQDGFTLDKTPSASIDKIITDPPWGVATVLADPEAQYTEMTVNFHRVLKPRGSAIILTSQIEAVRKATKQIKLVLLNETEVYVSGQKAYVLKLVKK